MVPDALHTSDSPHRRSPQYEKLAHDERRAPLDEEAAKPTDSNGDGHAPATTLPVSSDLTSPGVRASAPAAPPENLLTLASVARTGAVRCLQLDTEALISCREGSSPGAPHPAQLAFCVKPCSISATFYPTRLQHSGRLKEMYRRVAGVHVW